MKTQKTEYFERPNNHTLRFYRRINGGRYEYLTPSGNWLPSKEITTKKAEALIARNALVSITEAELNSRQEVTV